MESSLKQIKDSTNKIIDLLFYEILKRLYDFCLSFDYKMETNRPEIQNIFILKMEYFHC